MRYGSTAVLLTMATVLAGCGTQEILLGTQGAYLMYAKDALARPGEQVELQATLEGGDFMRDQPGLVVRFYRDGKFHAAAETDEEGQASVSFTPQAPGDYTFTVEVAPVGLPDQLPASRPLLVACRKAEAPIAVVDLDKTVVASGFYTVLIGNPEPMAHSPEVLRRLAAKHTVVYLTHRPEYFGPKSKAWLRLHHYPPGPVLLASISGFLKGSGQYKSDMIRKLKERFGNIRVGIGDKVSDVLAYHDNGLEAFLIIQMPKGDDPAPFDRLADEIQSLPQSVQVVAGWDQIAEALAGKESYPAAGMECLLRSKAEALRATTRPAKEE